MSNVPAGTGGTLMTVGTGVAATGVGVIPGLAIAAVGAGLSIYEGISGDRAKKKAESRVKRARRAARVQQRFEHRVALNQVAERLYQSGRADVQTIQDLQGTKGISGRYGLRRFNRSIADRGNLAGIVDAKRFLLGTKAEGLAAYAGQGVSSSNTAARLRQFGEYAGTAAMFGKMAYDHFGKTVEPGDDLVGDPGIEGGIQRSMFDSQPSMNYGVGNRRYYSHD